MGLRWDDQVQRAPDPEEKGDDQRVDAAVYRAESLLRDVPGLLDLQVVDLGNRACLQEEAVIDRER